MLGWLIFILSILLLFACIVVFFWDSIRKFFEKYRFKKSVYKVLRYYAEEEDQLLLNKVALILDEGNQPILFDHILFADKYIYIISDFSAQGGLYGNVNDPALFLKKNKGDIEKIDNPVFYNEEKVKRLEQALGISHTDKMLVSVVVFNSTLVVPRGIEKKEQTSWFLSLLELEKTIRIAEKDDVEPIRHEQSEKMAKMLQTRSNQTKREMEAQNIHFKR